MRQGDTQYLLDLEGLASIDPGSIVVLCSAEDQNLLNDLQQNNLWQAFFAQKNNRIYVFNRNLWSKGRGLLAFSKILEQIEGSGLLTNNKSQYLVCD